MAAKVKSGGKWVPVKSMKVKSGGKWMPVR